MPKKLHVRGYHPCLNGKQVQCVVAVTSLAEFCRITEWPYKRAKDYSSDYSKVTNEGTLKGCAIALANPGKIFWKPDNDWGNKFEWQEVDVNDLRY